MSLSPSGEILNSVIKRALVDRMGRKSYCLLGDACGKMFQNRERPASLMEAANSLGDGTTSLTSLRLAVRGELEWLIMSCLNLADRGEGDESGGVRVSRSAGLYLKGAPR